VITARDLLREEIELIWSIDRSEVIEAVYTFENETLVLRPDHFDAQGWPPGEAEKYTPILLDCFDRGGWFCLNVMSRAPIRPYAKCVSPIKYRSISRAAPRPSLMAQTTRLCPRRMSPAAKTPGTLVANFP